MYKRYRGSYFSYFLMYLFYYLSLALFSGLISVYLMDRGYSASQVSFVVSVQYALSMLTQPVFGHLSDRYDRKKVNGLLLLASGVASVLFIHAHGLWAVTLLYSIGMCLMNGVNPVIEKMATTSRHRYGAIRIWGTIGYAIGSQVSGIIYERISPEAMYLFFAAGIVLCVVGLFGTQEIIKTRENDNAKKAGKQAEQMETGGLWKNRQYLYYLLLAALFYGATNVNSTYLPAMYQSAGLDVDLAATVIFAATMMELPVILLSGRYMNRIGNRHLLMGVFALLVVQFGVYAFLPVTAVKVAATVLTKSVATMAFIMINLKVVATVVDGAHQITALAFVSTVKSLVSIVFQSASGIVIDRFSYAAFYMGMLAVAAAGLFLASVFRVNSGDGLNLFG